MISRSYLDFNATAPARPEVIDAVVGAMRERGNASSVHADGRSARSRVEKARAQVASLVGAEANSVVFTGSGTESITRLFERQIANELSSPQLNMNRFCRRGPTQLSAR